MTYFSIIMRISLRTRLNYITETQINNYRHTDPDLDFLKSKNVPKIIISCMDPYLDYDNYGNPYDGNRSVLFNPHDTGWYMGLLLAEIYYRIDMNDLISKTNSLSTCDINFNDLDETNIYTVIPASLLVILSKELLKDDPDGYMIDDKDFQLIKSEALRLSDKARSLFSELESLVYMRSNYDISSISKPLITIEADKSLMIPPSEGVTLEDIEIDAASSQKDLSTRNPRVISFTEVHSVDDSRALVGMALMMPDEESEFQNQLKVINEDLRESKLIGPDDEVVNVLKILGCTKLLDDGSTRVDQLLVFNEGCRINPIVRINYGFLKWASDFVVNYAEDYVL